MNNLFYPKLAFSNMKKNGKFYFPYMFTCILTIAMYYIMCSIAENKGLEQMQGHATLIEIMSFGTGVIAVFTVVFLFYTNSFLMKRRKKELGLYHILGMEKRHIFKVLSFETIYLAIVSLMLGLSGGILLDKILFMVLYKILGVSVPMGFYISTSGMVKSVELFVIIFFLILVSNFIQLARTKTIDLLHGENIGEKEPKAKWFLVLVGVISIGVAYYIAITTESPINAIPLFFLAVILVIIGTYCLFTAGSIALLKLLKSNKRYYYQTKHFVSVSGLMYRMKQNAVGLANICILSTMILVTLSTTVSLYIGLEDILNDRYPYDIHFYMVGDSADVDREEIVNEVKSTVERKGRNIEDFTDILSLSFTLKKEGDEFQSALSTEFNATNIVIFDIITAEQYAALTGEEKALEKNEMCIYNNGKSTMDSITLMGTSYTIKENLEDFPETSDMGMVDCYYAVVKDNEVMQKIYKQQKKAYGDNASSYSYEIGINVDGTKEEEIACASALEKINDLVSGGDKKETKGGYHLGYVRSKQSQRDEIHVLYGGFLFLGIFVGILFMMATTLIIYYKQISEGYEDKGKFEIMGKVGMTKKEVKASIRSQVLTIFFLPIVAAGIHVAVAFPMITKLLLCFGLMNTALFALCTVGTIVVFAIIYGMVYILTARVYYKIVS